MRPLIDLPDADTFTVPRGLKSLVAGSASAGSCAGS